jgi:hypothetical protein
MNLKNIGETWSVLGTLLKIQKSFLLETALGLRKYNAAHAAHLLFALPVLFVAIPNY